MRDNLRLHHTVLGQICMWLPGERITRLRNLALLMTGLYLGGTVHLPKSVRTLSLKVIGGYNSKFPCSASSPSFPSTGPSGVFGWPRLYPFSGVISISFRCNSRCRTCDVWRKPNKEWHCPMANASYANMLLHPPTLARAALDMAR